MKPADLIEEHGEHRRTGAHTSVLQDPWTLSEPAFLGLCGRGPPRQDPLRRYELRTLVPDAAVRDVHLCGPAGMTRTVSARQRAAGVPRNASASPTPGTRQGTYASRCPKSEVKPRSPRRLVKVKVKVKVAEDVETIAVPVEALTQRFCGVRLRDRP